MARYARVIVKCLQLEQRERAVERAEKVVSICDDMVSKDARNSVRSLSTRVFV
jgi:hypothetical protein